MESQQTVLSQMMQSHIAACKLSEQSVADYCSSHQLKTHQYYYWQKKLQPQESNFIKLSPLALAVPMSIFFVNGTQINFATLPAVDYVKQLIQ